MFSRLTLVALFLALPVLVPAQFAFPTRHTIAEDGQHGQRASAVQMDGAGGLDVLTAWSLTDEVTLHLNGGTNGPFTRVQLGGNFVGVGALAFDADCDGDLDVAAHELFDRNEGFNTPGRLVWYERPANLATSPWTMHVIADDIVHVRFLDLADVDRDGDMDLVICSNAGGGGNPGNLVAWFENRCGQGAPRWQRWTIATGLQNANCVRVVDIAGSNSRDIVVAERDGGRVRWFDNAGNPRRDNWTGYSVVEGAAGPFSLRGHDLNGDGRRDLLVSLMDGGSILWYLQPPDPRGGTWTTRTVTTDFVGPREVTIGDFNNDGRMDVASGSGDSFPGVDQIAFFLDNGAGGYTKHTADYYSFTFIETVDFDGDGDDDVITASYNGNRVDWWENRTTGTPVEPAEVVGWYVR